MKLIIGEPVNLRLERAYFVNRLDIGEAQLSHENGQRWRGRIRQILADDTLSQRLGITQRLAKWTKF